ncbi:hypothetical protein BKA56DRAFT_727195 [Ilyonectria sp. MPI-CAGE-AT-0026]|nr:hypothetical protein BKA56DRAFT_727195 [Ilyonectria sp. MPI-CAGE-AT-0026]
MFKSNQLAVVKRASPAPSPEQMQMIAREFNLSETVFLHGRSEDGSLPSTSSLKGESS